MSTELTIGLVIIILAVFIFFAIKPSKKDEEKKQAFLKQQEEKAETLKQNAIGLDVQMLKALEEINHNTKILKNIQVFYLVLSIISALILIANLPKL